MLWVSVFFWDYHDEADDDNHHHYSHDPMNENRMQFRLFFIKRPNQYVFCCLLFMSLTYQVQKRLWGWNIFKWWLKWNEKKKNCKYQNKKSLLWDIVVGGITGFLNLCGVNAMQFKMVWY